MPTKDIKLSPIEANPFPAIIQQNAVNTSTHIYTPLYSPNPYTTTDSKGQTTTYQYNDEGTLSSRTSHLGDVSSYVYDTPGRLYTITTQDGETTTVQYNASSLRESITIENQGTTSYTYNDCSWVTAKTDPIKGSISYTYNVRGDQLTNEKGTYSYDILGRKTGLSYTGGGSDTWSYTPDGYVATSDGISYTYDDQGNTDTWTENTNVASYSYTTGSTALGLPSSYTAQGNISAYSYTYGTKHWLHTLNNTSKPTQNAFAYSWSTKQELTNLSNPNSTQLIQTFTNQQLDWVQVKDSAGLTTYLSADATFNTNNQMTGYSYNVSATPSNFATSYTMTYHTTGSSKGKINTLADTSRTITYGYNSQDGLLNSVQFSTLGTYSLSRNTNGTVSTITYPNQQGNATFTYNGGQGKLSQIAMPGSQTISLSWNGKSQISSVTGNNNGSTTSYSLTYNGTGQPTYLSTSQGGILSHYWTFEYGPHGLEMGKQYSSTDTLLLTQNYTTDPQGRLLSMTYTDTNPSNYSNNGEYYFHYDHFGNMCLLTDSTGSPVLSYEYDLYNGKILNTWNPNSLTNIFQQHGQTGNIALPLGMQTGIVGDDYVVPLHSDKSRIAIGITPWKPIPKPTPPWEYISPPGYNIWDYVDSSLLKKKVSILGGNKTCPLGQDWYCKCTYYSKDKPKGKPGEVVVEFPVEIIELHHCHGMPGYKLFCSECKCMPSSTPF